MPAQFVPLQAGASFPIPMRQPILLVGRHPAADIRVDSPMISRRHCCLAVVNSRVLIRDLGSRHGVRVNGVVVEEAEVHAGDEVAIGHLIYRFEADTSPRPATRPQPVGDSPSPVNSKLHRQPPVENYDEELIPLDD